MNNSKRKLLRTSSFSLKAKFLLMSRKIWRTSEWGTTDQSFDFLSYWNNYQSYSESCFNTNKPAAKFFSSWLNGNIRKSMSKNLSLLREVRLKLSNSECCGTLTWVSEPATTSQVQVPRPCWNSVILCSFTAKNHHGDSANNLDNGQGDQST